MAKKNTWLAGMPTRAERQEHRSYAGGYRASVPAAMPQPGRSPMGPSDPAARGWYVVEKTPYRTGYRLSRVDGPYPDEGTASASLLTYLTMSPVSVTLAIRQL